ncbi:hypothetical protein L9F63_010740, partial [Diploptera punctata]
ICVPRHQRDEYYDCLGIFIESKSLDRAHGLQCYLSSSISKCRHHSTLGIPLFSVPVSKKEMFHMPQPFQSSGLNCSYNIRYTRAIALNDPRFCNSVISDLAERERALAHKLSKRRLSQYAVHTFMINKTELVLFLTLDDSKEELQLGCSL